jgi:hypothetical protein
LVTQEEVGLPHRNGGLNGKEWAATLATVYLFTENELASSRRIRTAA